MTVPPVVTATRYVTPLREGGSLPGLMEADDLGMYVVKFTGAGQGSKALVAEVICAEIAVALGLLTPRWAPVLVPGALAPAEPDAEVQRLLRDSAGINLGVDFLPGATDVGPAPTVEPELAGRIVWFDALIDNRDRSWRNPNMLMWHRELHLIDHGAALAFHHAWSADRRAQVERFATRTYGVSEHVLLRTAPDIAAADAAMAALDWEAILRSAVSAVPSVWLDADDASGSSHSDAYLDFLLARIESRSVWVTHLLADTDPRSVQGQPRAVRRGARPSWLAADLPASAEADL